jgi:hypothetical protein
LFVRPQPLPPGAAHYAPILPPVVAKADRKPTNGLTYAIDGLEAGNTQFPITGTVIRAATAIIVHGWAVQADTLTPGQAVLTSIDGRPPVRAEKYGIPRPDVGNAINPGAVNSGFSATVSVKGLRVGPHTIAVSLEDTTGKSSILPTPVSFILR